jgi:hypothetical protein
MSRDRSNDESPLNIKIAVFGITGCNINLLILLITLLFLPRNLSSMRRACIACIRLVLEYNSIT